MGRETRSDNDDLGLCRIGRLVNRSVAQCPSITTVRQALGQGSDNSGSSLVVPCRVPSLDDIARTPLDIGDVLVWVGAGYHEGTVGKQEGGRVVHSLVGRWGESVSIESRSSRCVGAGISIGLSTVDLDSLVDGGHVDWILSVRLSKRPSFIPVTSSTHSNTVSKPHGSIGEVDEVTHTSSLG